MLQHAALHMQLGVGYQILFVVITNCLAQAWDKVWILLEEVEPIFCTPAKINAITELSYRKHL